MLFEFLFNIFNIFWDVAFSFIPKKVMSFPVIGEIAQFGAPFIDWGYIMVNLGLIMVFATGTSMYIMAADIMRKMRVTG